MIWQPWGGKWYRSYLKTLWRKKGKIKYFDLILIPHNQTFLFETYNQLVSLLGRFLVLKSSFSKSRRGLGGAQIEVLGRWVGLVDSTASASIWLLPSALANSRGQASYHIGYPRVIGVVSWYPLGCHGDTHWFSNGVVPGAWPGEDIWWFAKNRKTEFTKRAVH